MYKVRVDYKDFSFDTLTNAMTFVGIVLNSAMEDYKVSISREDGGDEEREEMEE